ncbi:MAG: TPM domain-containing protein [Bacteriovoracaceae bacterium]
MKLILSLFFFISSAFALEVPRLSGPVIDKAGIISGSTERRIEAIIRDLYQNGNGPQVQVLTIPSLKGEVLENYSIKVVDKWKLGDEVRDDGVLFLVALNDRKMRIEVGQGLEGSLTDYMSFKIIDSIKPHFRSGKYSNGIYKAVTQIAAIASGDQEAAQKLKSTARSKHYENIVIFIMILFFILVRIYLARFGRHIRGGYSSGGFYSGGGWSSGGGGWSGGGGGFSGGGSSGSW